MLWSLLLAGESEPERATDAFYGSAADLPMDVRDHCERIRKMPAGGRGPAAPDTGSRQVAEADGSLADGGPDCFTAPYRLQDRTRFPRVCGARARSMPGFRRGAALPVQGIENQSGQMCVGPIEMMAAL